MGIHGEPLHEAWSDSCTRCVYPCLEVEHVDVVRVRLKLHANPVEGPLDEAKVRGVRRARDVGMAALAQPDPLRPAAA